MMELSVIVAKPCYYGRFHGYKTVTLPPLDRNDPE